MSHLVQIPRDIWAATSGLSPLARGAFFQAIGDAAQDGGRLLWNGRPITEQAAANKYTAGDVQAWRDALQEMQAGGLAELHADGLHFPAITQAEKLATRAGARERQARKRERAAMIQDDVTTTSRQSALVDDELKIREEKNEDQQQQAPQERQRTAEILAAAGVVGRMRTNLAAKLAPEVADQIVTTATRAKARNRAGLVVELCRDEIETRELTNRLPQLRAAEARQKAAIDARTRAKALEAQRAHDEAEALEKAREDSAPFVAWWNGADAAARASLIRSVIEKRPAAAFALRPLTQDPTRELTPILASLLCTGWEARYAN